MSQLSNLSGTMRRERRSKRSYTTIDNSLLQNKLLTFEARGLLSYLLSLPDDWQINITHLTSESPAGRTYIQRVMKELMDFNYVRREARREAGKFKGWNYFFDELPFDSEEEESESTAEGGGFTDNGKPVGGKSAGGKTDDTKPVSRETRSTGKPTTGFPTVGKPQTTNKTTTQKKHLEKANAFSRGKKKSSGNSEGKNGKAATLFSSEDSVSPSAKAALPRKRRESDWDRFQNGVLEIWNEGKRRGWPALDRLTGREQKDLAEFWGYFDKELDSALRSFRLALRWLVSRESWAEGKILSLAEVLANSKMIGYAQKASHVHSQAREGASAGSSGVTLGAGSVVSYLGSVNVEVESVHGEVLVVRKPSGEVFSAYRDQIGAPL